MPRLPKRLAFALTTLLALACGPAAASLITLQTRASGAAAPALGSDALNGAYYRNTVSSLTGQAPTAGYCDATLSNFSGISNQGTCHGGGSNIAFSYSVLFGLTAGRAGGFSLQIGPDFGRGGAVYLDGTLLGVKTGDLWWSGDYGNAGQTFAWNLLSVAAGNHSLSIFGLEGCCDGTQSARFSLAGAPWTTFGSSDGLNRVPEPGGLPLVLGALGAAVLAGAAARRRRLAASR